MFNIIGLGLGFKLGLWLKIGLRLGLALGLGQGIRIGLGLELIINISLQGDNNTLPILLKGVTGKYRRLCT